MEREREAPRVRALRHKYILARIPHECSFDNFLPLHAIKSVSFVGADVFINIRRAKQPFRKARSDIKSRFLPFVIREFPMKNWYKLFNLAVRSLALKITTHEADILLGSRSALGYSDQPLLSGQRGFGWLLMSYKMYVPQLFYTTLRISADIECKLSVPRAYTQIKEYYNVILSNTGSLL